MSIYGRPANVSFDERACYHTGYRGANDLRSLERLRADLARTYRPEANPGRADVARQVHAETQAEANRRIANRKFLSRAECDKILTPRRRRVKREIEEEEKLGKDLNERRSLPVPHAPTEHGHDAPGNAGAGADAAVVDLTGSQSDSGTDIPPEARRMQEEENRRHAQEMNDYQFAQTLAKRENEASLRAAHAARMAAFRAAGPSGRAPPRSPTQPLDDAELARRLQAEQDARDAEEVLSEIEIQRMRERGEVP